VSVQVLDRAEPNWTDPGSEIVRLVRKNGKAVLGREPAASLRLGFSDARFYRQRGIPSVGYGATAHNGNAPDEYVEIADLMAVFRVHALSAYDFLSRAAA